MSRKQYAAGDVYERKLKRVMERLEVSEYNFNWDRHGAWIEFRLRGELYRFDHSTDKAQARGINIRYGSDCFAQIVLSLEDLARMVERGIYELQTRVAGMRYLPLVREAIPFLESPGTLLEPCLYCEEECPYYENCRDRQWAIWMETAKAEVNYGDD